MLFEVFVICICFVIITTADRYKCSENEVFNLCKNPCEKSCQDPLKIPCPTFVCQPGCVCRAGTIRDETSGKCIIPQLCPIACPINEKPNDFQCEPTCQSQRDIICIFQNKKCICQSGLLRDLTSGKCVAPSYCPKECGINEEWVICSANPACKKTCQSDIKYCPLLCVPGCRCVKGYIWDEYSKACVPENNCPKACGINEEWKICSNINCRSTCQDPKSKPCPMICTPGCSCKEGFLWDELLNQCVPTGQCSTNCGINEEWKNCSNINCRSTCQDPKSKPCPMICTPGCSCKEGFLWDERFNQCVPTGQCPTICGINEEWKRCSDINCRRTCQNSESKPCPKICIPGCSCKEGFLWDELLNQCVPTGQCSTNCGINEEWKICSDINCRSTCQDPKSKLCLMICTPGCSCKEGFLWDELLNQCVPTGQCSTSCGINEEWKRCSNINCRRTCQNPESKPCPKICTPGCSCKEGFLWDELLNQCVPTAQCSVKNCAVNEEWKSCSDHYCRKTCQNPSTKMCLTMCIPGCSCKKDFIWDEQKKLCVATKDCSKPCEENQEWKECSDVNCRTTCQKTYLKWCSMTCASGCSCKDGYIWDEYYKKCVARGQCSKVCEQNAEWRESLPLNIATCRAFTQPQSSPLALLSPQSGCICKAGFVLEEYSQKCVRRQNCSSV